MELCKGLAPSRTAEQGIAQRTLLTVCFWVSSELLTETPCSTIEGVTEP
jgi:hypothetical protein